MHNILFTSLAVENFKSFTGKHSLPLDRPPGLYYVTGRNKVEPSLGSNGVGKSSLFVDAIRWCLFGRTGRSKRPGDMIEAWERKPREKVLVELEVMRNGFPMTIRRTRRPNGLFLSTGGDLKSVEQDEVDKAIGLSDDAFMRTITAGQFGELFLDLLPEQQSAMFSEMLNLQPWLDAARLASARVLELGKDQDRLTMQINAEASSLEYHEESRKGLVFKRDDFEDEMAKLIQVYKDKLKELRKTRDSLTAPKSSVDRKKLADALEAADRLIKNNNRDRDKLVGITASLKADRRAAVADKERLEQQLDEYKKIKAQKVKRCPECNQVVEAAHIDEKYAEAKADLGNILGVLDRLQKKIDAADADVDKIEEAGGELRKNWTIINRAIEDDREVRLAYETQLARVEAAIKAAQTSLEDVQHRKNPYAGQIADLKKKIAGITESMEEAKLDLARVTSDLDIHKYWAGAFKEIRLSLIESVLAELQIAANRNAEALGLVDWRIEFATERETKEGKVSVGFSTLIYPPGKDKPVLWEAYSGGEGQRFQLAVLFGLSEVLLGRAGLSPNIEVLDEPTRFLSVSGVDDLLEFLMDRSRDLGRAIYFVDHASLDRGAFDQVIMIEKDAEGSYLLK